MSHSHLPIRHLIRHIEKSRQNLVSGHSEDKATPRWVHQFVEHVADLFEPFSGVARVGYECCQETDAWEIAVFLGEKETVGGPYDGRLTPTNFNFNLQGIAGCFTTLKSLRWNAFPNSHVCFEDSSDLSFVTATGTFAEQQIRLQIHATPPDCVGPAIREHADGRIELV